jgi:GH43 family beta-xylosidase
MRKYILSNRIIHLFAAVILLTALTACSSSPSKNTAETVKNEPSVTPTAAPTGPYTVDLLDDLEDITYVNDKDVTGIGDPYLITYNNTYYVTATVNGTLFDLYKSTDMKKWDYVRKIFSTSYGKGWVRSNLWQPQLVVGDDGKFYLFFCGDNDDGSLRIGVAGADSIEGPYTDLLDQPLFDLGYATIDPKFYVDDDGKMYLYYSRDCSENVVDGINTSQIYVVEMESYTKVKEGAEHKLLLTPEQKWEVMSGNYRWNEGPDVLKHDGKYYLFYSGNFYASYFYSIGYAVSDNPEGPFVKAEDNPVLYAIGDMSGPGNNSFFYSLDGKEMFTAYHTHTDPVNGGGDRKLTIDRCGFRDDGTFYINGPTMANQPLPSGESTFIKEFAGVTVSSSADGTDSKYLTDGSISKGKRDIPYEWRTTSQDKDKMIDVDFGSEKQLKEIVLYRNFDDATVPENINIYLDDGGKIENITMPTDPAQPVILSFDPIKTQHVKIMLDEAGQGGELGLSEIMFLQ